MVNRLVAGGILCAALAAVLAGCAPAGAGDPVSASPEAPSVSLSPVTSPSPEVTALPTVQPVALEVFCDADLVLHVSSDTVSATSAGVPLLVSSEAPAGTYLTHDSGGDPLPASPETWMFTTPPGPLHFSCFDFEADVEGATVAVTVVDPKHYWTDTSLAVYGCHDFSIVDWAIGPAAGATPEEAVENLIASFTDFGTSRELTRREHAEIGYPDAATQTWVIGSSDAPSMTAQVWEAGAGYEAGADAVCEGGAWPPS